MNDFQILQVRAPPRGWLLKFADHWAILWLSSGWFVNFPTISALSICVKNVVSLSESLSVSKEVLVMIYDMPCVAEKSLVRKISRQSFEKCHVWQCSSRGGTDLSLTRLKQQQQQQQNRLKLIEHDGQTSLKDCTVWLWTTHVFHIYQVVSESTTVGSQVQQLTSFWKWVGVTLPLQAGNFSLQTSRTDNCGHGQWGAMGSQEASCKISLLFTHFNTANTPFSSYDHYLSSRWVGEPDYTVGINGDPRLKQKQ